MFYKGSLDKLGIEADVIQIGPKYKNAPDQYTRTSMGEGQKEVINAVLDEYYGRLTAAIAESRKKSPEDVKAIIDGAPYNAVAAKSQGLIDEAFYQEQVYDELKTRLGYKTDEKIRTVSGRDYREIPSDSLGLNNGERVAVIFASGAINIGSSNNSPFGGQMVGSDTIVKAVNDAAADTSIKAIVLRVDSPGGSALASDLMWYALENAKAKKPVVVSMSDVAASGGYYIACNANKIVAEPSTVTGSIGMFMGKPVVKGLYDLARDIERIYDARQKRGHLPGNRALDARRESQDDPAGQRGLLRQFCAEGGKGPRQDQRGGRRARTRARLDRYAGQRAWAGG